MKNASKLGVEAARKAFPALVEQARQGKATLVTRHGKPWAMIVPPNTPLPSPTGGDIRQLRGSGKGLWGRSASRAIDRMRREWDRD